MNNECDKCLEHILDCICNINLCENFLSKSIRQIEISLGMEMIEKEGLLKEFSEFYEKRNKTNIFLGIQEFAKLHPDKFYIIEPK